MRIIRFSLLVFVLSLTLSPANLRGQSAAADPFFSADTYIVVLRSPSVVERAIALSGDPQARRRFIFGPEGQAYARSLDVQQSRFAAALATTREGGPALAVRPPVEILARRSFLLNMLVVRVGPGGLSYLGRQPEVRAIYPNLEQRMQMDMVPTIVSATDVWTLLGGVQNAGDGVRIGIIDSGVNPKHPAFSDDGFPPAPVPTLPGSFPDFTNNKVVIARDYVTVEFGYASQAVKTPEDELGHGTCVASVAAAVPTTTPILPIQGMAPHALLGNYKVFGAPGVNENARSAAVAAAINDATADGMDILNLSMGGSPRLVDGDIEQEAIQMAAAVGVLTVIAAGNSGPAPGTVASPGTSPTALTVGATNHARYFAPAIDLSSSVGLPPSLATIGYTPADGQSITSTVGPLPLGSVSDWDASCLACSPLPAGSLIGRVALVRRGACFFSEKYANVAGAGAVGMVVYQNEDQLPVIMSGITDASIAIMIEKAAGEALQQLLPGGAIEATFGPQSQLRRFLWTPDQMASFSSRGPDINTQIKPDIVAPGDKILAAVSRAGSISYTASASGTSFSTPVAAGAAALLRQLHPDWTPEALKSSLVNSADKTATWEKSPAPVMVTGNGRLNVERAAALSFTVAPVSLTFGVIEQTAPPSVEREIYVTNQGGASLTLQAQIVSSVDNPCVEMTVSPSQLTLSAGETHRLVVAANLLQPVRYGAFEGYLRLTGADSELTASYWGACADSSLLEVSKNGSTPFASLDQALSAARPGSTIEIADSGVYDAATIQLNEDGIPLHGLTLRAAPGASPTIRGTGEDPALAAVGVERLAIQGIAFKQASIGLSLSQSTGTVTDCEFDQNGIGIGLEQSRMSLRGARVTASSDYGIAAFQSGLNLADSVVRDSAGSGVELVESSGLIQRSAISEADQQGISADAGGGLGVFESLIEGNRGAGLELFGIPTVIKDASIQQMASSSDGVTAAGLDSRLEIDHSRIGDNGGAAISLFDGAELHSVGLRAENNAGFGLDLQNAAASVQSGWFKGNFDGIRAVSSNIEVRDSLIVESNGVGGGAGIHQSGGTLNLLNSTIARNAGPGVKVAAGAYSVANNILYDNGGDLTGVESQNVVSNLIGDGLFNGLNFNFQANPLFVAAGLGDYSLGAGSPAIDAASASFPFSATDAAAHDRVIDGDGDGTPKADLGGFEYGSTGWTPLVAPVLSTRPDEFVGLAMVNSSPETCAVGLRGYNTAGQPFGSAFEKTIPPGSQFSILLNEALGALSEGWVEVRSDKRDLMTATLVANWGLTRMDGAALAGATGAQVLLPEALVDDANDTRVFVVNTNSEPVDVRITWRRDGASSEKLFPALPAKGALDLSLKQLFPGISSSGYLIVETPAASGKPIFAMEIFTNGRSFGGLLGLDTDRASSTLLGAQLASTPEVETTFNLVNLGPPADATVEAFDEAGKLVSAVSLQALATGAQRRIAARDLFSLERPMTGWIRVTSSGGRLLGSLTFNNPNTQFLASLPLQPQGAREFVLDHVAQTDEVFTGVALLNAGEEIAEVSVEVFDSAGVSQGLSLLHMQPHEKRARLLWELVPGLVNQQGGFIRIRSSSPLAGYELFGNSQLTFMSAVPPQVTVW